MNEHSRSDDIERLEPMDDPEQRLHRLEVIVENLRHELKLLRESYVRVLEGRSGKDKP